MVKGIASIAINNPGAGFLKTLTRNSKELTIIAEDFIHLAAQYSIFSFWEEDKLVRLGFRALVSSINFRSTYASLFFRLFRNALHSSASQAKAGARWEEITCQYAGSVAWKIPDLTAYGKPSKVQLQAGEGKVCGYNSRWCFQNSWLKVVDNTEIQSPVRFLVPYSRNKGYIGNLAHLRERLIDHRTDGHNQLALWGLGGVG